MNQLFLFPGQGSQYVGMGKFALELDPVVRQTFEEADDSLEFSLSKLMFEGPEEVLKETQNSQPAILTVSVAIGRMLQNRGEQASVMAGHSLGEYSALVLSGAMKFKEAVKVVQKRGTYMQEAVPIGEGTMSAVLGAEDSMVEKVCQEVSQAGHVVEPANYNCPGQLVISGTNEGVKWAVQKLGERGVKKCIPLKVSAPFHCSLLKPAALKLEADLSLLKFRDPQVPYIANVDCSVVKSGAEIVRKLVEQVYKPVRWSQSLKKIVSEFRPERMIEIGPGNVVSGHMKKIAPELPRFQTDSPENLKSI